MKREAGFFRLAFRNCICILPLLAPGPFGSPFFYLHTTLEPQFDA